MLVQVAAGITWGLGMSSFISNHPEFSATQALDFLERGHERQNKLALQQADVWVMPAANVAIIWVAEEPQPTGFINERHEGFQVVDEVCLCTLVCLPGAFWVFCHVAGSGAVNERNRVR